MSISSMLQLLLLAALWGASFLFMRTASPEFGPVALIGFRAGIAALFLLMALSFLNKKDILKVWQHWRPLTVLGLTNTAIPFCCFAFATLYLEAGLTATINSTAPMFGALIAFIWLGQSLSKTAIAGLLIGFLGVYLMMSGKLSQDSYLWLPVTLALFASACYGFSASYSKRYVIGLRPMVVATGSQVYATLMLIIPVIFTWPEQLPSSSAWVDVVLLGVACTGIAYILYFRLLANEGVTAALSVTFLIPLFAFLWGWIWLAELLTATIAFGAAMSIVGVAMTTGFIKFGLFRRRKEITKVSDT
ncbi:MAG: DMT family transporter [Aestuariibacter sp.]